MWQQPQSLLGRALCAVEARLMALECLLKVRMSPSRWDLCYRPVIPMSVSELESDQEDEFVLA